MRTRVFLPTYPTWALVGGTSRPTGETVCINQNWDLRVSSGYKVQLTFDSFNLEKKADWQDKCSWDYLEVSYEGSRARRYCGDSKPPTITSNNNNMKVKFRSDGTRTFKGFSAKWKAVKR